MPSTSAAATSMAASQSLGNSSSTAGNLLPSPSPRHLLSLPFRALPGFSVTALPRRVAKLVGLESMATRILGRAADTGLEGAAQMAGEAAGEGVAEAAVQESGLRMTDIFHAITRFSSFFAYMTSRWSLACFSVVSTMHPSGLQLMGLGSYSEPDHDLRVYKETSALELGEAAAFTYCSHRPLLRPDRLPASWYTMSDIPGLLDHSPRHAWETVYV